MQPQTPNEQTRLVPAKLLEPVDVTQRPALGVSRMQQVLKSTKSASSRSAASVIPIAEHPRQLFAIRILSIRPQDFDAIKLSC